MRYLDDRHRKCHQVFKTSEYEREKNRNPDRVEGTCQWVLNHNHYQSWLKSTHDNLLWISADPGCGKSVLSKSLIDRELKILESCSICYFFFKDNETQNNLSTALCALLHQLFSYQPRLLHHGISSWDQNGDKLQKETADLWRILLSSATDDTASNIICIIDALDECANEGQLTLIKFLTDFYNSSVKKPSRNSTLKFLVTSRPYFDIERPFQGITTEFPNIRVAGEEANKEISSEIDGVVHEWVRQLSTELNLQPHLQELLRTRLQQIKNRTYLWLYLVFEKIRNSERRTVKKLTSIIDEIPKSVDEMYENILNKSTDRREATILLSMIVSAKRPLTLKEMDVAFALVDQDNVSSYGELQLERENLKTVIRNLCGLFVYVDDSRVHLLHQTGKEFLMKRDLGSREVSGTWKHSLVEQDCEVIMARTCIRYLLFSDFEREENDEETDEKAGREEAGDEEADGEADADNEEEADDEDGEPPYDFMDYSATYWPVHFREADLDERASESKLSLTLFNPDSPRYTTWFPTWNKNTYTGVSSHFRWTRLICAACCGLLQVVNYLLDINIIKVDSKDEESGTALLLAAIGGHNSVAKLLVENGADVNFDGQDLVFWHNTPLVAATSNGDQDLVQFLLKNGADVNVKYGAHKSVLEAAASWGKEAIMRLLMAERADGLNRALRGAAGGGQEAIVRLLIAEGANDLNRAVERAAQFGKEAMVRLLIAEGADDLNRALWWAAGSGHEAIVRLLIAKGADDLNSGLWGAAQFRQEAMVRLLIAEGANDLNSALWWAAGGGKEAIVRLLIAEGANDLNRAVERAAQLDQEAIVRLLIAEGADDLNRALWWAAGGGHEAMVPPLIAEGEDVQNVALQSAFSMFR
jgi:ankyrin repeat protein